MRWRPGRSPGWPARSAAWLAVVVGIQPGQPGRQPVDLLLGIRVQVDELAEALSQPGQGDLLVAAAVGELLQAASGEVHRPILSLLLRTSGLTCQGSRHERLVIRGLRPRGAAG